MCVLLKFVKKSLVFFKLPNFIVKIKNFDIDVKILTIIILISLSISMVYQYRCVDAKVSSDWCCLGQQGTGLAVISIVSSLFILLHL